VAPNGDAVFEFAANLSIIKSTRESADVVIKYMRALFKALADQVEELWALAKSGAPHVDARSDVGRPLPATLWATQGAKVANSSAITGMREDIRTLLLRFRPATRFLCSPALRKNK
jgi:hypothetical protein